ncbi:dihydrofolate reductase [Dyadobacter sp. 32]|uniref:dihydrofolate reductase n=1 Tax=Dyadobacter sp. 32 TaxID=538966 RepID=UPI0011EC67DA
MNKKTTKPDLYIIAAMSENRVIGNDSHLPWHLPDEWENFKKITNGKPFLMGRKSYEAPDALHSSYRNVVLTKTANSSGARLEYAIDLNEGLALLHDENEVFILGGASVFEQTLPLVDKLYLTVVHTHLEGDAFFPAISLHDWELISSEYHGIDANHAFAFSMNLYERKQSDSA